MTRPARIRGSRASLRDSQVSDPIVPGAKTKRQLRRGRVPCSARASAAATAMPLRLSLASDGWQTCV